MGRAAALRGPRSDTAGGGSVCGGRRGTLGGALPSPGGS